jgi:hypothetical protein
MLTVVWNPHEFHLIDVLPNGSKFNAGHYISRIPSSFPEILALDQDDPKKHFWFTLTMPYLILPKRLLMFWITILCTEHLILLIRRSGPSDFGFFGHLKEVLQGSSFDEPDELLSAIQEALK